MKSLEQFINEARKFPHLNPKVSVNQEIKDHLDYARRLPNTNIMNSFVSFTSIDKLGINPQSTYDTPLGIYSYPSQYVIEKTGKEKEMTRLPFAGQSPYANIFSVRGNIVDVSEMDYFDLRKYYKKIMDVYLDADGISGETDEIKQIINDASSKAKFAQRAGGRFWYVTMKVSDLLMKTSREWGRNKHSVAWNRLFREIGINGCIDMGVGIIHTAEPSQAVFFSKKMIKDNKRVYNKYSPKYMERSKREGQMMRDVVWTDDWNGDTWKGGTWKGGTWYDGLWKSGRWKYGTWKRGTWERGIWEDGTWERGLWEYGTWKGGTWERGGWLGGTWEDGTWERGKWEDGTWEDGTWEGGLWEYGTWKGGTWKGGRWMDGTWEKGTWEDGEWYYGEWKGGTWHHGRWKGGIWKGGAWLGGYDKDETYHPAGDSPDKW